MSLLTQSSLVLIPSGYKEDTVYSVIPNDATGDMSFTRASDGTRINSDGLVENTPWNLLTYSEDLSNVIWGKINVTINSNTTVAPNGTTTADTLTNSSTGYGIFTTISVIPNQQYTFSFYIKKGTNTSYILNVIDASTNANIALLNYSSQVSATDWVRITSTFTIPSITTSIRVYQMRDGASLGTAFLWGAQLNIGSTAKPYFPTTDRLNVPRLTYQNGGGGCPSLLLEPQRTNVYLYSSDFSNAAWLKSNCTQTPNFSTSVISGINATKIDFTTIGFLNQTTSFVGNTTASIYVIVKADTLTKFRLVEAFYFGNFVEYDLVNETATGTGGFISDLGNGWFQCGLTKTYGVGQTAISYSINSISTIGSLLICGAQAEAGTYATSYIPTVASSATRIVDTYQKAGIGNTSTAGTLYYELIATNISSANGVYLIQLFAGSIVGGAAFSDANSISIAANGNQIKGYNNGYTRLLFTITPTFGSTVKIAIRYNGTNVVAFVDGTKQTVYADTSVGVKNALRVNNGEAGSQATKELIFFPTDLTDAECIALTTL